MKVEAIINEFAKEYSKCSNKYNPFQFLKYMVMPYPDSFHDNVIEKLKTILDSKKMKNKSSVKKLLLICEKKATLDNIGILTLITSISVPIILYAIDPFSQINIIGENQVEVNKYINQLFRVSIFIIGVPVFALWFVLDKWKYFKTGKYSQIIPYLEELYLTMK